MLALEQDWKLYWDKVELVETVGGLTRSRAGNLSWYCTGGSARTRSVGVDWLLY